MEFYMCTHKHIRLHIYIEVYVLLLGIRMYVYLSNEERLNIYEI